MRSVVVLPAPFGPRKPVIVPGETVKVRSSIALTVPNCLLSLVTDTVPSTGACATRLPPSSVLRRRPVC